MRRKSPVVCFGLVTLAGPRVAIRAECRVDHDPVAAGHYLFGKWQDVLAFGRHAGRAEAHSTLGRGS